MQSLLHDLHYSACIIDPCGCMHVFVRYRLCSLRFGIECPYVIILCPHALAGILHLCVGCFCQLHGACILFWWAVQKTED